MEAEELSLDFGCCFIPNLGNPGKNLRVMSLENIFISEVCM